MTVTLTPAPVVKTLRVPAPPARAFDVFTAGMARWWPKTHSIGREPLADVTMEPRTDGRWFETGEGGATCDWGRVLAWEPPHRLVLAWQITADWTYDPNLMTEVEVTFTADGDGTVVRLEHRGLEAYGARAADLAATLGSPGGWPGLMDLFAGTL